MHALALLCINQHTTFDVPSFTSSKDMIGGEIKKNEEPLFNIFIFIHHKW